MRRLLIYFLLDVSESMVGEPIIEIQKGIESIIENLRHDPYAFETVYVSSITFAGKAKKMVSLTELFKFKTPVIPIGGGTSLGNALNYLMDDLESSIQKTSLEFKGDWKPIVFLFTDGTPTDNPENAFNRWNKYYRSKAGIVAVSIGENVDTRMLGKVSDNVLRLRDTDSNSFKDFFKWITASIKTSSVSVTEFSKDELKLPRPDQVKLEKIDTNKACSVEEKYAVILGKCQSTRRLYLIKYVKEISKKQEILLTDKYYNYVGAYAVNEESYNSLSYGLANNINEQLLIGDPKCPCYDNRFALTTCP